MSELTDLIVTASNPATALMIIGLALYIRAVAARLEDDIEQVRDRVARLETNHFREPND